MKIFIVKIIIFTCLVFLFQIFLHWKFETLKKNPTAIKQLESVLSEKPSLIFFGDSTINFVHPKDKSIQSTTEMLVSKLPNQKIIAIRHDAYDLRVYNAYINHLVKTKTIKYLVVPINLRSFGYNWETTIPYQFTELRTYLYTYRTPFYTFIPFLENLKFFDLFKYPVSQAYYDKSVKAEIKQLESENLKDRRLKELIILDYMYLLKKDNYKLKQISEIIDRTNQTNIIPIFYITPIDYQYAGVINPRFVEYSSRNIELIKTTLAHKKSCLLDLSYSLKTSDFAWQPSGLVNEHLNEIGREFIASRLAETISEIETDKNPKNCTLKTDTISK